MKISYLLKPAITLFMFIVSGLISTNAKDGQDVGAVLYRQLNGHKGLNVSRTFEFDIHAAIDEAFYLFTPIGEAEWETGFEPIFLGSDGTPKTGLSFWTHNNTSDGELPETETGHEITLWLMTSYAPETHKVTYARIKPLSDISLISVELKAHSDGISTAKVRYDITSISNSGNEYIKTMDEKYFENWIKGWQTTINDFLKNKVALNVSSK